MKIKFPEKIVVLSHTFTVIQDINSNAASFDFANGTLIIGTKSLKCEPAYVWMLICHELMEMSITVMGCRYDDPSALDNYKFFMDHKQFQTSVDLFSRTSLEFIK
jgi:hypothetical protein